MIDFWKITPGGNPTVLLRAEDVPIGERVALSKRIMSPQHVGGEQVGFVQWANADNVDDAKTLPYLTMMGGEFCLNATRAFALLLAMEGRLPPVPDANPCWQGKVRVSGADEPVAVGVEARGMESERGYFAWAQMRFARLPNVRMPDSRHSGRELVRLPGITHLVLHDDAIPDPQDLPDFCTALRQHYHLEKEEAVGFLWLNSMDNAYTLFPVVWVRETQSLCRESACGSGTLACAMALHGRYGAKQFAIAQPSGFSLNVRLVQQHNCSWLAQVGGQACLVAQGKLSR